MSCSLDESTTVDMQSRMAVFVHVVKKWERVPLFVAQGLPEIQGGGTSKNLFKVSHLGILVIAEPTGHDLIEDEHFKK